MARIKVEQEIDVYEVDGEDGEIGEGSIIKVNSHWSRDDFVVLEVGGKSYTVAGDDLETAITNAQNSGGP